MDEAYYCMDFLVILDFDGTSDDRADTPSIHPDVVAALARGVNRGWRWALNSDRGRDDLLRVACELPTRLRPAAVVAQRRVIDLVNGQGCYRPHTAWNQVRATLHHALWQRLAPHLGEWADEIRAAFRVRRDIVRNDAFGFIVHPVDVPALRAHIETRVEVFRDAAVSSNHESCFIVHREFCKGTVCREISRVLGIGRHHVGAIGDAANDLPMLQMDASGAVGCPASASADVQRCVCSRARGYVARSDGAIGTAEVLEAWLLAWPDRDHIRPEQGVGEARNV